MKRWQRIEHRPYGIVLTEVTEDGDYTQRICWAAESITTQSTTLWEENWRSVEDFLRLRPGFVEVEQ